MEFVVNKEYFKNAVSDVSRVVSLKNLVPILSGIKIVAKKNGLILVGSSSEIVIEKKIPLMNDGLKMLEVQETGSVVLSAKYLNEIVKKLPNDIHFKVNEKHLVNIQSNEISASLKGLNSEEYPSIPQMNEDKSIKISSIDLIEMTKQTTFAVSKNQSRPVLTGVHIVVKENKLSFVATNSHRLAYREIEIDSKINGSCIVPSSSLNELTKFIHHEPVDIHIFTNDSFILFKSTSFSFYTRLIDGNYPNLTALLSRDSKTVITMNKIQLLRGIDRASLFASELKNNNVNLEVINGTKLRITSNSSEIGNIEEIQTLLSIEGETEVRISLDGDLLMDALKAIKEETIKVSFSGSMRPILIESNDHLSYFHLISPVRTY